MNKRKLLKLIKERYIIADKDNCICTDTNDANYYAGLFDGYLNSYELIKELD